MSNWLNKWPIGTKFTYQERKIVIYGFKLTLTSKVATNFWL